MLSTIFNWGKPRDPAPSNPAAGIPKVPRPRDMAKANRAWSEAERDAVLGAVTGGLKMAIALGMFAGMRIGDAVRVTWSIYDGASLNGGRVKPAMRFGCRCIASCAPSLIPRPGWQRRS